MKIKSHGMGCLFEDDKAFFPVTQKEWDYLTSPEKITVAKEPHCPICGSPLDYNAYEDKYKCLFCGYEGEPFRKFMVLHPEEN